MINPRLMNVPFTISWIFAGVSTICFSMLSAWLLNIVTKPTSVLSRSFAPDAPATCQLAPVEETFHVTCASLKGTFNRYTRTMRSLLERSADVHNDNIAEVIVAFE